VGQFWIFDVLCHLLAAGRRNKRSKLTQYASSGSAFELLDETSRLSGMSRERFQFAATLVTEQGEEAFV